jgi:hypothetical protein
MDTYKHLQQIALLGLFDGWESPGLNHGATGRKLKTSRKCTEE